MIKNALTKYILVTAGLGLMVACSSSQHQRDAAGSPAAGSVAVPSEPVKNELGTTERSQGNVEVQSERKVVRTETVKQSVPTFRETRTKADINRMDVEDFVALGLPRQASESVVQQRKEHGKFTSVDDLAQVPGVPQEWFKTIRPKLGAG